MTGIGQKIKDLRKKADLTQDRLADYLLRASARRLRPGFDRTFRSVGQTRRRDRPEDPRHKAAAA